MTSMRKMPKTEKTPLSRRSRLIGAALALWVLPSTALAAPVTDSAWRSGVHPNLFVYHGIANDTQVQQRLEQQYNQLFLTGDSGSQRVMRNVGGDMAYIEDIASGDIRSEGMSYGMMIAVMMDDQTTFDRLWRFADNYMQNSNGTFAWSLSSSSPYTPNDTNPAPDAEEYFAMSLFFAHYRWGSGSGVLNYQSEARAVLDVLRTQLFNTGSNGGTQILFSPAPPPQYRFTDPSYHLPAFYELWKRWDNSANSDFWGNAHFQSRYYQFYAAHPETGLFSEYATFYPTPTPAPNGPDNVYGPMTEQLALNADVDQPQARNAPHFFSDAYRVIGNIAMDYAWFTACCANESTQSGVSYFGQIERNAAERQLAFFAGRTDDLSDGTGYRSAYQLDGTPLSGDYDGEPGDDYDYRSAGHVAMNAVGALAVQDDNLARPFVQALWNQSAPEGQYRYYDGMLHMLAMLHVSGRFRIYGPTSAGLIIDQSPSAGNQSQISYRLRNTTNDPQSNLTAYYYLTAENGRTPVVDDLYTPNIDSLSLQPLNANQWAVAMHYGGIALQPGESVSQADTFRIRYNDWSGFDTTNDFSQPGTDQPEPADRVAVFNQQDRLLMGDVPEAGENPDSGTYTIRVRARGTSGQETINLTVGGAVVASWSLTSNFADYVATTGLGGGINVEFVNDDHHRDVVVDYLAIGGELHQAEDQSQNSAAWGNGQCGGGQYTEWMHCDGYLGFNAYK